MSARTVGEAKDSVGDFLPGFLTHKVTGERVHYGGGLSPRQVPTAWVQGLKDAGVEAKVAKVRRDGGWATLPLVVQFECPFDHVNESGEGWAKVRLLVNPYIGWVSIHEDSCPRCTQQQIEEWLVTCPRCVAGDEHEDHDDPDLWCLFVLSCGDESPIAFVVQAMWQFQRGEDLVADTKNFATWTVDSVIDWLDSLVNDDGSPLVPQTAGQSAAWELVKDLPGHPSQSLIREAQAMRKKPSG